MTKIRDLGFSPFIEGYAERAEYIVEHLSETQIKALTELETFRKKYFKDFREYARRNTEAILRNAEDGTESNPAHAVSIDLGDLAWQMNSKFNLQMAEILVFGKRQGDLPAMETERIIET